MQKLWCRLVIYGLTFPKVCPSSFWRSSPVQHWKSPTERDLCLALCLSLTSVPQGDKAGSCRFCGVTQTGMLTPDTSACCQTVLFRQSIQSQMALSSIQTSSSYWPIFCISCYKPPVQAIRWGFRLWYSQTNQNDKWALPRWSCADRQVWRGAVKNHFISQSCATWHPKSWKTRFFKYDIFHMEISKDSESTFGENELLVNESAVAHTILCSTADKQCSALMQSGLWRWFQM